uniref:Coiled-coil domain containing 191 n=1 Tax=Coturnix japonica TaxID=93934 RepID=A0A8C2U3A8_COTJA
MELASEYAVSAAFCLKKPRYPRGFCDPAARLDAVEQLQECDEACMEGEPYIAYEEPLIDPTPESGVDGYLKHELESSSVQEYLQHLLQNEAVNCRIVENLRLEDTEGEQKPADPRITMELRHKQVKENRLRHQKALEFQRQEKALRKAILSEAKLQIQEEDRRKALKAKKEDEEIQREMVKLRKEMAEKRQTMAEQGEENQRREVGILKRILKAKSDKGNDGKNWHLYRSISCSLFSFLNSPMQCMQRHFSAWFRLILEHRIEMEKARVLADWKCQQKVLRAWRNYTWAQKVEQETQRLEVHLQDQNRKNQLSAEHNQRRLLRCCFLAWQHWSQAELPHSQKQQLKREETKRKMAKLLEAVSLGKNGLNRTLEVSKSETAKVNQHQVLQQDEVKSCNFIYWYSSTFSTPVQSEIKSTLFQRKASCPGLPPSTYLPKTAPAYGSCFEHHHAFQEHLTEEQKQQLQKQQELILELQENQRLSRAKEEAVQATAAAQALDSASQTREKKMNSRKQSRCQNATPLRYRELEKQRRLEKEQQLQKKARDHYEKALLRKLGMVPWKKLREQAKENLMVAQRHHCLSLQRKCLMSWFQHTQERLLEKVSQAEDFFSHMLIRWCFRNWLKVCLTLVKCLNLDKKWSPAVCQIPQVFRGNSPSNSSHLLSDVLGTHLETLFFTALISFRRLVLDAFKAWRQYPLLMKKEREREERRNQLRRRVAEILPDFQTWQNEPKGD